MLAVTCVNEAEVLRGDDNFSQCQETHQVHPNGPFSALGFRKEYPPFSGRMQFRRVGLHGVSRTRSLNRG